MKHISLRVCLRSVFICRVQQYVFQAVLTRVEFTKRGKGMIFLCGYRLFVEQLKYVMCQVCI